MVIVMYINAIIQWESSIWIAIVSGLARTLSMSTLHELQFEVRLTLYSAIIQHIFRL